MVLEEALNLASMALRNAACPKQSSTLPWRKAASTTSPDADIDVHLHHGRPFAQVSWDIQIPARSAFQIVPHCDEPVVLGVPSVEGLAHILSLHVRLSGGVEVLFLRARRSNSAASMALSSASTWASKSA